MRKLGADRVDGRIELMQTESTDGLKLMQNKVMSGVRLMRDETDAVNVWQN